MSEEEEAKPNYADLLDEECHKYCLNPKDFVKNKAKKDIRSGYGSVSFCIQKSTNIGCVVKKTNTSLKDVVSERSFYREIETLVKCIHPTIVPFVGFAILKNYGFIYLIEAKNGSLQSFIEQSRKGKRDPNFNSTAKFIISYGVAKSMEYLHQNERIHRDLKPGNVLLDEHLHPLLTDFGTSKKLENVKQINQTLSASTASIMSPEFIQSPERFSNTKEIDIYAYGMTLYELWTEIQPFGHIKAPFQLMKVVSEGERPSIPDSMPEAWKDLIERCWDVNTTIRPPFNEIIQEFDSGIYYTDDMDIAAIEKYKKSISIDSGDKEKAEVEKPKKIDESKIPEPEPEPEPEPSEKVENAVLTKMRQDAEAGDVKSQFNLVIALVNGTYGDPDYAEALKYAKRYYQREGAFEKVNLKNSATMEFYAGRCYVESNDINSANFILKQSVGHGCWDAAFFLAELMFDQKIKNYRTAEMENYYRIAADNGIPEAIKKYSYMLLYGSFDGRPDKKKAINYIQKGSDQGDPELMHAWSVRLEFGRGVDQDIPQAMELMKLSADRGYSPAMVDYGIHLLNGIHVPQNKMEAKVRFQAAAAQNDAWGQLWYYVMNKENELVDSYVDDDFNQILTNCLESNQSPEAWAVYGRELYEQENVEDSLSPLFYACQSGSYNGFLCLGNICEENPQKGDSSYYYELASHYCHCLDTCGFTSPIPYKIFHCNDCDINICEACAKHCHADHGTVETIIQSGFKCECGKNGFKGKCSAEFIGETKCRQHLYQCTTCCILDDTKFICKSCAENCHKGHKIIDCGIINDCCSCGMKKLPHHFNCKLLKFDSYSGCSCDKCKQRWFQCVQCGLYGSKEVGICEACSKVCHEGHTILDLGVNDGICSCKNANCFLQQDE